MGRAVVLPGDAGLHPIDIEEPGHGAQREPERDQSRRTRISKSARAVSTCTGKRNKQIGMSDPNLGLSNACNAGVPGTWLAQPGEVQPLCFPCFS